MTGPGNANVINIAGSWDAVFTVTSGSLTLRHGDRYRGEQFSATFRLVQRGSDVEATFVVAPDSINSFAIEDGWSGQLTGFVLGQSFTYEVERGQPCPALYHGDARDLTADGATMSGTFSGSDCGSVSLESTFVATRR